MVSKIKFPPNIVDSQGLVPGYNRGTWKKVWKFLFPFFFFLLFLILKTKNTEKTEDIMPFVPCHCLLERGFLLQKKQTAKTTNKIMTRMVTMKRTATKDLDDDKDHDWGPQPILMELKTIIDGDKNHNQWQQEAQWIGTRTTTDSISIDKYYNQWCQ